MVCPGLEEMSGTEISDILSYPNMCNSYFYVCILGAIFVIITWILYRRDEEKIGKGDLISSMGVSSIATIFLSLIANFVGMLPRDRLIEIIVIGFILIAMWIYKSD